MAIVAQTEPEIYLSQETDSLAADSVSTEGMQLRYGLTLSKPDPAPGEAAGEQNTAMSWVLTGLLLAFVVSCLRYRKNGRYLQLILKNVTEMRERSNVFDDTLRETSFVWILNLLWSASAGVLLYAAVSGGIRLTDTGSLGLCMAIGALYTLFLSVAYLVVGTVFSDTTKASFWVKGYLSTQGLTSIGFLPAALVAICVPGLEWTMIIVAAVLFAVAKILFIYKSFCIFFSQTVSWVLFLYYLCSLEIVPIVLTYAAASYIANS